MSRVANLQCKKKTNLNLKKVRKMKKLTILIASLAIVAAAITGYNAMQSPSAEDILLKKNIEALANNEAPDGNCKCLSGGPGATACSHEGGIGGIGYSCSVECGSGYYACCAATCYCCKE